MSQQEPYVTTELHNLKQDIEAEKESYISREEFDEFEQSIKELQESFIDFFVTYGLDLGDKVPAEAQEHFKERVRKLLEL